MKTQEKTPKQKTPIFENRQKKHPKKNTNSEIRQKNTQTKKHQFLKMGQKTPKKKHPKKHLPDYHCPRPPLYDDVISERP